MLLKLKGLGVSPESINGTGIVTNSVVVYMYTKSEENDKPRDYFEEAEKFGSIVFQDVYITRNMKVTGIFQTYSNMWGSGQYSLPNAFITEEAGEYFIDKGYYLSKKVDGTKYKTLRHLFIDTKLSPEEFYNKYKGDFENLKINTNLYSDIGDSTESTLTYGILLSIFLATVFSVFLIYFTQMKRRSRRIALLKSIGATNDQIGKLLFWEVCYLLIATIPIGIVGGIGLGKVILNITNKYGKTKLDFHVDIGLTVLGVLVGIVAILISMLAPMIMSMKIPLTGTISEPPRKESFLKRIKKNRIKTREVKPNKSKVKAHRKVKQVNLDMEIQTYGKISLKTIKYNKGKYILTAGLYTLTITILLGCVFLSFLFFGGYINNILITGKPSFAFEVNHGLPRDKILDFTRDISSIEGVTDVEVYKVGERAYLWYEGIEENVIYKKFREILPTYLVSEHFGFLNTDYVNLDENNEYLVRDSIVTNIYGIDVNSNVYKKFENSITKGSLNKERFEAGEEVILMLPIYNEIAKNMDGISKDYEQGILSATEQKNRVKTLLEYKNVCDISYDFRHRKYYLQDNSIKVGDTIHLTIPTEDTINNILVNDVAFNSTKVGAIIYYFPEIGIWPFADTIENPVVIGSYNLTEKLYPKSALGKGRMDSAAFLHRITHLTPTRYGKTWIYVHTTNSKSFDSLLLTSLQKRARDNEFKLHNYKEANDIIYRNAFTFTLITIIIGIAAAVIACTILYYAYLSKLEQERDRIGIFQALGVTKEQFKKQYLMIGFAYGLIALIVAHILFALAIIFTSIGNSRPISMNIGEYISYILDVQLWMYPWVIHIIICIVFFAATVLTYYLPLGKIIDNQPIDNIRNLGR